MEAMKKARKSKIPDNSTDAISPNEIQIKSKIDCGSYASIVKAIWQNKKVAVKQIDLNKHHATVEKCEAEVNVMKELAKLSSHYFVAYYGSYKTLTFNIVMEYFPSVNLRDYILEVSNYPSKIPSADDRIYIMRQIAESFVIMHKTNIIYADLKPENILIGKEYHIKLCDFGFSMLPGNYLKPSLSGTPEYIAPELIKQKYKITEDDFEITDGNVTYSTKSDIFAMGITFWECYGFKPYTEDTLEPIFRRTVKGIRNPIADNWPDNIKSIIQESLDPDFEKRPDAETILTRLKL